MGALVLAAEELVIEVVLNFVHSIAKDVIGLLIAVMAVLFVFGFGVVAFFQTHASALSEGDIFLVSLSVIALPGDICNVIALGGMPVVWCGIYGRLHDCPFEVVHQVAEAASSAFIGGKAIKNLITMGNEVS